MMIENIFATSLTSMHWLFPQHLDSKQTLGFEPSLEIRGCRDNVACPGNQIQTCGCMENQDLYPMVVASSQIGNQYFHFLYENINRKILRQNWIIHYQIKIIYFLDISSYEYNSCADLREAGIYINSRYNIGGNQSNETCKLWGMIKLGWKSYFRKL